MDPNLPQHIKVIGQEWYACSRALADWAMLSLVNRKDVWVQYTTMTPEERLISKRGYKAVTLPQKHLRGTDMVTIEKLARHFGSFRRHHLIGLHTTSPDNTSKWFSIDIDQHEKEGVFTEDAGRRNLAAALSWWETLQGRGYDPLLYDSNGNGGYQVFVLFAEPAPTPVVYAQAQSVIDDWDHHNLDRRPETYPRQPRLDKEDRVGAALRLPGLHHTYDHVTCVWSGEPWLDKPWLEGRAAIDVMMGTIGGPPPPPVTGVSVVVPEKPVNRKARRVSGRQPRTKTVAIDLDGVLAQYDGWKGGREIGGPVDGAVEFTRGLSGWARVIIFTVRLRDEAAKAQIEAWLREYGFAFDEVSSGKPLAHAYVDDRGISCRPQEDGPVAFVIAEEEIRVLCGERPRMDPEAKRQLLDLASLWPILPPARRRALLEAAQRDRLDKEAPEKRFHA